VGGHPWPAVPRRRPRGGHLDRLRGRGRGGPERRPATGGERDDAIVAMMTPTYEAALRAGGRRVRPPYTIPMMITIVAALAEGLRIRWSVQPATRLHDRGLTLELAIRVNPIDKTLSIAWRGLTLGGDVAHRR